MISNYLKVGALAVMVVGMVSCNKGVESNDEQKIVENEAAINSYLGDSLQGKVIRESTGIVYYKRTTNAAGEVAKTGDAATVKFTGYLLNGTKVLAREKDSSYTFPVDGYITGLGGLDLGIKLLRTGEKGSFFLPFYLAFGNGSSAVIPAYSPLRLEVEFIKTRTEAQQITEYIAAKQFVKYERTADNLVIIRTNTVTGDTLGSGKSVGIKYVGRLLNGSVFDEGTIASYTTNAGGSITGFDRAIRKMRKTEKAIVIFPSALGYGKNAQNAKVPIYPYSPLQFEIEIL